MLAALLIFGRRLWPAVALGAFIANATSGADPLVAAGIAGGNARQVESLRNDILSSVSHELRTPLGSVLNFSVALQERREDLGEQAVSGMLAQIVRQARRLDRLLSDLLDVDRLRHGLVVPLREPADVARLVSQVVATHQGAEHGISVSAEPTTANVDVAKVERIVDNLVGNAVKHTLPGTPIDLLLERRGEDLLIVVEDSGPGIPDEYKTTVFEIFDRGSVTNAPGTGIGLSLVARFAELHGGRAWVEDSSSGGASGFCCRAVSSRKLPDRPPRSTGPALSSIYIQRSGSDRPRGRDS